jgi:serine/threonine-protein kinase
VDGREYSLPPEDAWEKAGRGVDGRFFPWGNYFDWSFTKGGLSRSEIAQPEPVGTFPADRSPYGARDLAGTIREWTLSTFDERSGRKALRGGSWNLVVPRQFRCAARFGYLPEIHVSTFGFRLFTKETLKG